MLLDDSFVGFGKWVPDFFYTISAAIWHHRYWSTLVEVMACWLKVPSHYQNQSSCTIKSYSSIHLRAIQLEIHMISNITKMSLKIAHLKPWSTLAQAMACCLMAPSHYLNQCWLLSIEVLWHSPESNLTVSAKATILYYELTHWGLVTPFGDIDLGQHWLR